MADEVWKAVVGFEGLYEVSSLGCIRRSFDAPACNSTKPGRMLKPDVATGYQRVTLARDRKSHRLQIHRLVAQAFLGTDPRRHVNHKDGNKLNNAVSNLEWATPRENTIHAWTTGLCKPVAGERHGMSKLCERDVSVIRSAALRGVPQRSIAQVFNVTESLISAIVVGRIWTHDPERKAG